MGPSPANSNIALDFWREFPKWLRSMKVKLATYEIVKGLDADDIHRVLEVYCVGKKAIIIII